MMTDEQIMALPKKAANRAEVDACYYLGAFGREVERMQGDIEKRVRMIPGGWRDLRMIASKTENLLRAMLGTFEPQKAAQIHRMENSLRVKLEFNRQVVRENDMLLVDMDELGVLITEAREKCKLGMCMPEECRSCQLGRVLDNLSFVSRENRAWWEVFEKLERGESA